MCFVRTYYRSCWPRTLLLRVVYGQDAEFGWVFGWGTTSNDKCIVFAICCHHSNELLGFCASSASPRLLSTNNLA